MERFLQRWISHLTGIIAQEYPPRYEFDLNAYGSLLGKLSKSRPIPGLNGQTGLMLADAQSLMINRMAAVIAAQYVTDFVLHRQVSQLGTTFNLSPSVMRPILVTKANLARCRPR